MNKLRYLVLSDIHFGHPRNKTKTIVSHLESYFKTYSSVIRDVDLIILAGDVYDRLLNLPSEDAVTAIQFLTNLVKYCSKNDIALRILEGTPMHDWKQCRILNEIIQKLEIDIDFLYIDTLQIDRFKEYRFLYVPDEYNPTTTETMAQIDDLLDGRIVDIAIVHGQFTYHLPVYKPDKVFDEEFFLDRVKHYIHVGHIHTFSTFRRIITHGSFDRLSHGEEESKGGLYVEIDGSNRRYVFLENKDATIFKTVDMVEIDTIEKLDNIILSLPKDSHVRLVIDRTHPMYDRQSITRRYPNYHIKFKTTSSTAEKDVVKIEPASFDTITLTKDTLLKQVRKVLDKFELNAPEKVEETIRRFL